MNCLTVILAMAIAVVASAPAENPTGFDLTALDFSCSGICNGQCSLADNACRLIPGQEENCDSNLAACTGSCQTSCDCLDGCTSKCKANAEACNPDNSVVDAILCSSTNQQCQSVCPLSCGFKAGSAALTSVFELIQSQFPTPSPASS